MSMKEYPAKLTTGYYRVREDWEDEASQLGAYRLLANAKAKCDENPGSRVFDNDGNVIYPEEAVPVTGAEESGGKAGYGRAGRESTGRGIFGREGHPCDG